MKFWEKRSVGFVVLAVVYVLAAAVGIVSYLYLPFAFWLNLLLADVIATVVTFIFSVVFRNASVYDPYWSVQPPVIVAAYAIATGGLGWLQIALLVVIGLWALRLTANWAYTFHGLAHQDWRYTMLKTKTKKLYPVVNFLGIHLVPTLIVYACTLPVVFLIVRQSAGSLWSIIGLVVSSLAVLLQGTADCQMHAFRRRGTGGFIRSGVWKYSRHPNYLAEILFWWGVAIAVVCTLPSNWYLIGGAVANTLLFLCISIPLADGHQARKPGFAAYKAATHRLLPIKLGLRPEPVDQLN